MRKITAWFLFIILLGGIGIVPFLPSVAQADTRTWCIGVPIPSGYVITKQFHDGTCSGVSWINAYTIMTPYSGMTICMASPIPSGYVITSQGFYTSDCPDPSGMHHPNTLTIRTPTSGMTICLASPIPSGYVRQEPAFYTGACPDPSGSYAPNACVIVTTQAPLTSIEVTPTNPNIASGTTQQFTATGKYGNNTTQDLTASVTWSSWTTAAATISNAAGSKGLATSVAAGQTSITAASGSISRSTVLTVTSAPLVSIQVTPANPSIASGTTQQFIATGKYTDNTMKILTASVTWSSSSTAVATISNAAGSKGLATSVAAGQTTIKAASGSISGSTPLTVTPAPPAMLPTQPSLRDLTLTIANKKYPDRFKFDVYYKFYAAKTTHDNYYQIEIKVIPEGAASTTTSFAPPTTLNYTASQGSQLFQGIDHRMFTGTLTVNAPAQGELPQFGRLSFIVKVTGGPPVKVAPGGLIPMSRLVSASKSILLENVPYKQYGYRTECTGATGGKGDVSFGLGMSPVIFGPIWPVGQPVLNLNGTNRSATAVGQEVKLDTNPMPGIGERGVRWLRLWYWSGRDYVCNIHWWCEGFSNTNRGGNTYDFRYTITTNAIMVKVP